MGFLANHLKLTFGENKQSRDKTDNNKIEPYDGESSYEECKDDNLPLIIRKDEGS